MNNEVFNQLAFYVWFQNWTISAFEHIQNDLKSHVFDVLYAPGIILEPSSVKCSIWYQF